MTRVVIGGLLIGVLLATAGCLDGTTDIRGHYNERSGQYFGNLRIVGDGNNLTVLRGSRMKKLSICGNNNTVTLEENVTLAKVEFWGHGNTVSIPDYLLVRSSEVGSNQIIYRPRETQPQAEWPPPARIPGLPAMQPAETSDLPDEIEIEQRPQTEPVPRQPLEEEDDEPHFRPPPPVHMEPPPPLEEKEESAAEPEGSREKQVP